MTGSREAARRSVALVGARLLERDAALEVRRPWPPWLADAGAAHVVVGPARGLQHAPAAPAPVPPFANPPERPDITSR